MLKLLIITLFLTTTLFSSDRAIVRLQHQSEQRVALVIGNNNYKGEYLSRLHNPINDARAIRKVLQDRNFEVIYAEDVSSRTMKKKLKIFYKKIRNGGVGFLYFSGHGMEFDGENYLLPIDAQLSEKADVEIDSIAVNTITRKMKKANNRLNIVVLDACRNDPFAKGGSGGLTKIEPEGILVAYATSAGKTASDGKKGENGLFTKHLIKYMKQDGLALYQVFKNTRASVYKDSRQKQRPAIYDQVIGQDFFFTLPDKKREIEPKPNANAEDELWSMVKNSHTIEDYNYYISSYPNGKFIAVANYKIKKLKPKKQEIKKYTLKINPTPSNAKIQITNIKPKYYDGIELEEGIYIIKVLKEGYHTKIQEVNMSSDLKINIHLSKHEFIQYLNEYLMENTFKNMTKKQKNKLLSFLLDSLKINSSNQMTQNNIGYMYYSSYAVKQDYKEAMKWFKKVAIQNDSYAQYFVGKMYLKGYGVKQDYKKALKWLKKSAIQNDVYSQRYTGYIYFNGLGVKKDYKKALKWYKKAAAQNDASAQFNIGNIYFKGLGVKQDYKEALKWYKKAAKQNNQYGLNRLGNMYRDAKGIKQDHKEALKYYKKAAAQNNANAQVSIGYFYADGLGVKQDYKEALKWYRKAEKQNNQYALYNLGNVYQKGKGVKQDYKEALKYYEKAAKQNNHYALNSLGDMYRYGKGVKQDINKAIDYYKKAIQYGSTMAKKSLKKIESY